MITVEIELGDRSYPVLLGSGASGALAEMLPSGVRRVAIVTQQSIGITVDPGVASTTFVVGVGEEHKNLSTIERIIHH